MGRVALRDRALIGALPVLSGASDADLDALIERTETVEYAAGASIDADRSRLLVVVEGRVAFVVGDGESRVVLTRLDPGSSFDELGPPSADTAATAIAETATVVAAIDRAALDAVRRSGGDASPDAAHELAGELTTSIDILRGLDLDGRHVTHVLAEVGDEIVSEGDESDAVYFVLDGFGLVVEQRDGTATQLSRVGPGQCFGELGVAKGRPRAATVVAETALHLLRVEADEFRAWQRRHPHLRALLAALERTYRIRDGRLLSVYRGDLDGDPTVTTVQGDPIGECVVSTQVVGRDVVVFARRPTDAPTSTVRFQAADGSRSRMLHLVEDDPGSAGAAMLVGVTAEGSGPDLGVLYRAVADGARLSSRECSVFRSTGHLGGRHDRFEPDLLCTCLRLTATDLDAVDEEIASFDGARSALGAGLICGSCEAPIEQHLTDRAVTVRTLTDGSGVVPRSTITRRDPELVFDRDLLHELSGIMEFQVGAAASLNSNAGERFLVATLREAQPLLDDLQLLADLEVFIDQEQNHIRWHSELNDILVTEIFPHTPAVDRARQRPLRSFRRLPLRIRLAICAATEHSADVFFAKLFADHYGNEGAMAAESPTEQKMRASGVGELFAWHGREELEHRHVAFDVMTTLGTPYRTRVLGFFLVMGSVVRNGVPALLAMRRFAGPSWRTYLQGTGSLQKGVGPRLLAYLRPDFHPHDRDYEFMDQLRADTDHIPVAP